MTIRIGINKEYTQNTQHTKYTPNSPPLYLLSHNIIINATTNINPRRPKDKEIPK